MAHNKVKAITRTVLAGSSLTSSYQAINSGGLGAACFQITLFNTTNGVIDVSYDGSTNNDIIPANGSLTIAAQTNNQPSGHVALFAKGQVVYVKGSSGSGNVYLSGYYVAQ
jgi:flagellar hook assembly protein FlgD